MTALVKCRASSAAAVSLTRIDDHSMATLGSPVCCFMASLITADGEVTDEGTREFLRNYMTELQMEQERTT